MQASTTLLTGAVLLTLACIAATSAGGRPAATAPERCPSVSVDTQGWQLTRSFELGVEILHPPRYERKMWQVRSPGYPATLDLRRDGRLARTVSLELLVGDTIRPFVAARHGRTLRCTVRTRSGDVPAMLERVATTTLPTERDSFYAVRVRLLRADGRTAIDFRGRSIDSTGYVEQMAIAASLRLAQLGATTRFRHPPRPYAGY